jgi:hypothetical protein
MKHAHCTLVIASMYPRGATVSAAVTSRSKDTGKSDSIGPRYDADQPDE